MKFKDEIINKIRVIVAKERGSQEGLIREADVARALGMTHSNFCHRKKRKKLPLEEIIKFCADRKVDINWVLYHQFGMAQSPITQHLRGNSFEPSSLENES